MGVKLLLAGWYGGELTAPEAPRPWLRRVERWVREAAEELLESSRTADSPQGPILFLRLPSGFEFRCVPYAGLPPRVFRLRLGVNTGGDKLTLVLRIQQAEQHTEAIAEDFRATLAAKLGTASTLTLGTFTP